MTENITITNCQVSGFDEGTLLDGTRRRRDEHAFGGGPTGRIKCGTESNGGFRNITISNCVFEYCRGLALESVDGALSNIFIDCEGGGTARDAERVVPEDEKIYPEPSRFGKLSSWGLFARHVSNFSADRVEFRVAHADLRPVVWLEDATDAIFDRTRLPASPGAPTFVLKEVTGFSVTNSAGLPDTRRAGKISQEKL
jgi:hypothetical protein